MNGPLLRQNGQGLDLRDDFDIATGGENGGFESRLTRQNKKSFFASPPLAFGQSDRVFEKAGKGILKNGAVPAENGTKFDCDAKDNSSAFLHGAFSSPLTSSPSKFVRKSSPTSTIWDSPPIERNRRKDFDESDSSRTFNSTRQNYNFASSPPRKKFYRQSQNASFHRLSRNSSLWGSPSTSNEANSSMDSEDPFAFKPVPVKFMFDCSPIAPFFTDAYCFSNHFRCASLIIDGQRFICTEQYYMFYKARVFGDQRAMRQIMATEDPKVMKRIGVNVEGFDQEKWYKIAIQVMVIASIRKFEQNSELRRQLFETSGADLIEVNPTDQRWSIGLGMGDWRIREKQMWKGLNWMGRLLTKLRDKLLERPEFRAEKEQMLSEISTSFEAADSVGCLQRFGGPKKEEEKSAESPDRSAGVDPPPSTHSNSNF